MHGLTIGIGHDECCSDIALRATAVIILCQLPKLHDVLVFPANRKGTNNPVSAIGKAKKHNIVFGAASFVFDYQNAVFTFDHTTDDGKERHKITGLVDGVVISVIFTERFERIRIISARKATRHEERDYHNI
ncbi:MAG: BrnT family toxin [bacterium]|nr:BrnT family toxin [bacterium]